jgi:hypothetical protein
LEAAKHPSDRENDPPFGALLISALAVIDGPTLGNVGNLEAILASQGVQDKTVSS